MPRTSRTEVESVFRQLCIGCHVQPLGIAGEPPVHIQREDGTYGGTRKGWHLDYASEYGGWVIASTSGEGSGEGRPFSIERQSAGAFVSAMRFAITALNLRAEADR